MIRTQSYQPKNLFVKTKPSFILKSSLIIYLILTCAFQLYGQDMHWESITPPASQWDYITPTSEVPSDWATINFDSTSWGQGTSGIGYGDDDDSTVIAINTISVYMRKSFSVVDVSAINRLLLDIDYDDGFIAYLNGVEIARSMLYGDVSYNTLADGLHEGALYQGNLPDRFFVDKSQLLNGNNVLAVQVHNHSADSSDMSALPVLSAEVIGTDNLYSSPPFWFQEPDPEPITIDFQSSNLPIVILNTSGEEIPNEPKIEASMKIIKRPDQERNYVSDSDNTAYLDFDGSIQIEVRGSSSTLFSKKQYALTTYDDIGEKDNVKLLGLPKENDWILSGLAFDTTFVRDFVSYKLSNSIGQYASRAEYCELILNGQYQGLYMLLEKLKVDDSRIDLRKMKTDDVELPNLSGGYVSKSDKIEGEEVFAWSMSSYGWGNANFAHEQPKPEDITEEQNNYIQQTFYDLATTSAEANSSFTNGYPSIIDIPSFVDYMIISELSSNADSYQFSTYFHKDRRGKLRAGPVWDFNLTFGNDLFFWGFDRSKTNIWQMFDGNVGATFWQDLFNDSYYNCYLAKRWGELTAAGQPLSEAKIFELIDQTVSQISEAVDRQEEQWNIDIYFTQRIANLKAFVTDRLNWISSQLTNTALCDEVNMPPLVITKIHYHPAGENEDNFEFIEITNNSNVSWDATGIYIGGLGLSYQFPPGFSFAPNQSVVIANNSDSFLSQYGSSPFDEFSRKLSNSSEDIVLVDGFGNVIDEVTYNDEAPWPDQADGNGAFLQLADINADNSLAENWGAMVDFNNLSNKGKVSSRILVYPNPVSSLLYVSLTNGRKIEKVNIYDLSGKLILSYSSSEKRDVFDLEPLNSGVYVIEIKTDSSIFTERIIRQ